MRGGTQKGQSFQVPADRLPGTAAATRGHPLRRRPRRRRLYRLRRPALDGRTEILLSPLQFLARLVDLLAPPRKHRRRYFGVLAPRARLRPVVTATAGPAGTVQQELEAARKAMALAEGKRPASRSRAMLLARIHENCPLQCPRYGQPMIILAFILDMEVIERILRHIGEDPTPPRVLPARSPPQLEMPFAQTAGPVTWPEMNQTTDFPDDP